VFSLTRGTSQDVDWPVHVHVRSLPRDVGVPLVLVQGVVSLIRVLVRPEMDVHAVLVKERLYPKIAEDTVADHAQLRGGRGAIVSGSGRGSVRPTALNEPLTTE